MLFRSMTAQNYLGFSHSRFAGFLGVEVNPASILTKDLRTDWLIPVGFDLSMQNNGFTYKKDKASGFRSFETGKLVLDDPKKGRFDGRINVNSLGFMLSLSDKDAIAVATRLRAYGNIKVNEKAVDLLDGDFFNLFDDPFTSFVINGAASGTEIEATGMIWGELGLTYSRTIWESKYDDLKAGVTVKFLEGVGAGHFDFRIDELSADITSSAIVGDDKTALEDFIASAANTQELQDFLSDLADDSVATIPGTTTQIDLSDAAADPNASLDVLLDAGGQVDYSDNFDNLTLDNIPKTYNGFGFDIGFVYEFKENPKNFNKYIRSRIHKPVHSRRNDPPYKWKLGVSVMDIGRIKFDRGQYTYLSNGGKTVPIDVLVDDQTDVLSAEEQLQEIEDDFEAFLSNPSSNLDSITPYNDISQTSGQFTVGLPTTLNIDWDYHWKKSFYLNVNGWISMAAFKFSDHTVRNITKLNVTPRFERDALALFLPMSLNYMGQFNMGVGLRAGPLMLGVQNIGSVIYQKRVNRLGVYFALAKGFAIKKKVDESKSIYFRNEMKRYNR